MEHWDANEDARLVASWTCGMRTLSVRATTPLARLSVFAWGIRIEGRNKALARLMPPWEARYSDLAPIRPVAFGGPYFGSCIRFMVKGSLTKWAICGTSRVSAVLDSIELAGGTVVREPLRVYRMDPAREYPTA